MRTYPGQLELIERITEPLPQMNCIIALIRALNDLTDWQLMLPIAYIRQ